MLKNRTIHLNVEASDWKEVSKYDTRVIQYVNVNNPNDIKSVNVNAMGPVTASGILPAGYKYVRGGPPGGGGQIHNALGYRTSYVGWMTPGAGWMAPELGVAKTLNGKLTSPIVYNEGGYVYYIAKPFNMLYRTTVSWRLYYSEKAYAYKVVG